VFLEPNNMQTCLNCGYERKPKDEGMVPATECPKCGIIYDKIGSGQVRMDISKTAESTEKKAIRTRYRKSAFVLGVLGLVVIVFGLDVEKPEIHFIGYLSLTTGLAFYAKSKGRGFVWFLWGLFYLVGPIMGYIALALSKDIIVDDVQSQQSSIGVKSNLRSKRHMTLAELVIVMLIISILAYVLFIDPYMKASQKEKLVDIEISQMTSQFQVGMDADDVTQLLATNGFRNSFPSKKDPEHLIHFDKSCCGYSLYNRTLYEAYIEYDVKHQLKLAQFTKSRYNDGSINGCVMLFEVPSAKDKTYPSPCSTDVLESQRRIWITADW